MKRIFLFLLLSACESSSSSSSQPAAIAEASIPSSAPSASASTTPSATISASIPKPTSGAPSSLSFCKGTNFNTEPLLAICALGEDWTKAHFECAKPLPVNFCTDLSVWGCQYVASAGEKTPRVSFAARFVRPGVAPKDGEIIDDNSLRSRFPRAGITRGVTVLQKVSSKDEGLKVSAALFKKFADAGCVLIADESGWGRFECGSWKAEVAFVDATSEVRVDADTPTSSDCSK